MPTERVRTASEASLGRREVDTFILSTCEMPPEAHRYGEHRILHCPMPVLPRGLTERERRERLDALSSYEFVVTDSELAQRKVLAALRYIGGPALPVEFILPPIPETEGTPGREDIVVSAGRFRNGLAGGSHDLVLRGFQEFLASSANRNWQLICVGEIESQDDLAYFQDFSFRAAAWQVRCILMPTGHQRMQLYRRAKVCVSANASGVLADDEDWANLYAVIDIRDAIGHGCVPVVYARGAEAELCEHVGFRFVFDRADEVAQQIALAAAYAQSDSFLRASPLRGGVWSRSTFYKGWDRLLASKIENIRSEPAVNF
jgi:hypothetical protein